MSFAARLKLKQDDCEYRLEEAEWSAFITYELFNPQNWEFDFYYDEKYYYGNFELKSLEDGSVIQRQQIEISC